MVKKLLGFSRRANLAPVPTNLAALVTELSSLMRRVLPPNIDIVTEVAPKVPAVLADPGAVQQILLNLVTNARDAMPDGGRIILAIRDLDAFVCLSVSDTGSGMDEATKTRVFEPFFTTKPAGKGTGLGMAMVHGLVVQHGGQVEVESALGEGTTVRICLPIVGSDEAAPTPRLDELRGGTETILVAEDEAPLRRSACRLLARLGYKVLAAADGQEALDLCRARGAEIHLVVADGQMPRLTGQDLYDILQRERPEIRFLLASGYTVDDGSDDAIRSVGIPFLAKPWTIAELASRVREVLDQH
jgi:CheY-like chemotaxis protein